MDSITQIVLGAAVAEASIGKKVGNKAPMWGAIAGTIPDLDVLGQFFLGTIDNLAFHRSISHSITFCLFAAPILGWLIAKIYKKKEATFLDWTWAMFLSFFTHPLLDAFTTWGTMLFWPFTEYRVAIKSIFVVDPLYTLPFMFFLIWAMALKRDNPRRKRLNDIGIIISTTYLFLTVVNKTYVDSQFEKSFETLPEKIVRFDSRPTPMNNILWTANAESEAGFHMGYYSLFDNDLPSDYKYVAKNHELLEPYKTNKDLKKLMTIVDGFYTVVPYKNGYAINDLRFGEVRDFETDSGEFVFTYIMDTSTFEATNMLEFEQKRNSFEDGKKVLNQIIKRAKGKTN